MPSGIGPTTIWQGKDLTLLAQERIFDPSAGWGYRNDYIGTKEKIDFQESYAVNLGWRSTRSVDGDQHRLSITTPDPSMATGGATEVPIDTYEIATEYETLPFWTNPMVLSLTYTSNDADRATILWKYMNFCKKRIRDFYFAPVYVTEANEIAYANASPPTLSKYLLRGQGPTPYTMLHLNTAEAWAEFKLPSEGTSTVNAQKRTNALQQIYDYQYMTGNHWEVRRVVLSRRRSVSVKYAGRYVVDGVEKIWPTDVLVTAFSIPPEVAARLPADPATTPPFSLWAWRIRRQDSSQVKGTGRVEETVDWLFAAWSLLIYQNAVL